MREGFRESRRCSRDTYLESYISEYNPIYKDKTDELVPDAAERAHVEGTGVEDRALRLHA